MYEGSLVTVDILYSYPEELQDWWMKVYSTLRPVSWIVGIVSFLSSDDIYSSHTVAHVDDFILQ